MHRLATLLINDEINLWRVETASKDSRASMPNFFSEYFLVK
jgi:hypothetical protein